MRRSLLALVLAAPITAAIAVGCAFGFAPGDYGSGPAFAPDAASDGAATPAPEASAIVDAPEMPGRSLLVLAGERDGPDSSASDVWRAPILPSGDVGPFEVLPPAIFRGSASATHVVGSRLVVAVRSSPRGAAWIDLPPGPSSVWRGSVLASPAGRVGFGHAFRENDLLTLGGGELDGAVRDDAVRIAPFTLDAPDAAVFGPLVDSPAKLPVAMKDMQVVRYKAFVYLIGGDSGQAGQGSKVYVARTDADAGVTAFTATAELVHPQTGQPHAPTTPNVCLMEGRLYVLGGRSTDVALTSAIDESTGNLGPWQGTTRLPGEVRGAGCAIWDGRIHLVGGIATGSRTDRIIRARILADGKLGEWELSSGAPLPAPRSGVTALLF